VRAHVCVLGKKLLVFIGGLGRKKPEIAVAE
jgi:hypothetical protein